MTTMLNNVLNAHTNMIVAMVSMIVAITYGLMAHAVGRNQYDRFAQIVDTAAKVVGLIASAVLAAMAITNHKVAAIIMLAPMASFDTEFYRLGILKRRARNEEDRAVRIEREARRIPAVMSGLFALLVAVSATSLWNCADVNGNAAERAVYATAHCNQVASCGEYQFVWTPYEINAEGDASYGIPNADQCRLYVYQNGKLIGTDVIHCTDVPNTAPFTDEVKIVGYHYDDVYFKCGNGMLYRFAPGTSFTGNNDHIDAIGENIVSCDFFKGAYRYNDYRKTLEHIGWGDNEWTPTEDEIPFDTETISNFYSCQYM